MNHLLYHRLLFHHCRYASLNEHACMFFIDRAGSVVYVSSSHRMFFSYPPSSLLPRVLVFFYKRDKHVLNRPCFTRACSIPGLPFSQLFLGILLSHLSSRPHLFFLSTIQTSLRGFLFPPVTFHLLFC